ncbi:rare lipoprotein A [Caulobacter rhizosphaerae]|uniref:Endolytic peptidoglycan transglycosylase RlpA n=1 Tax=Caulobacter rhizosphaerae TaxID=2010972 RepID=A0ABU1N2S1_9CAUL|nr:septal ring lytic transglycosylase RlpA family protein [Caulobacter rhizosphaerae]MDR6532729.1 rare lipoprotein A [Caulobacter rhizosphaerae]
MDQASEARGAGRPLRGLAAAALGCAGLAACATPMPTRLPPTASSQSTARPYSGPPAPGSTAGLRGTEKPYQIKGIWYYPKADRDYDEKGIGSWYGEQFHNRRTANGEIFDMDVPSAAHKTLPLPSIVEVTNLDNGRKLQVRVNDRGPFVDGRIIDLSKAAAEQLGYGRAGVAHVRVRYVGPAGKTPFDQPRMIASAPPPSEPRYAPAPRTRVYNSGLPPAQPAYDAPPPPKAADPDYVPSAPSAPVVPAEPAPVLAGAETVNGGAGSVYRVQAGSFANRGNAERAVAQLGEAGETSIEPIQRAQGMLYRVVVQAGPDEAEAFGVRDRVAALGFSDATVLRP